jgi:hypothetical protein
MGCICGPIIQSTNSNLDGENSFTDLEIQQIKQLGISSITMKFKDDTEKEVLDKDI